MDTKQYDVLAIGAHPDDVEVGCGGVLIDLVERGYKCCLAVMTMGEMGTGGSVDIRTKELNDAAAIMKADVLAQFNWGDTTLEDKTSYRLEIARLIRQAKPKIVLTPYPHVGHGRRQSHPDHVACGLITVNAANIASLKKADVSGEAHLVSRIFHYFLPPGVFPTFVVDITKHFDTWIAALSAHRSQFLNPDKGRDYIEQLTAMARGFGQQARCKYGQAFVAVEPILLGDMMRLVEQKEHF